MERWKDPVVDEVHRIRDEQAARFNYDLDAIFADIQERERTSGRIYVRLHKDGTKTYVRFGKEFSSPEAAASAR